MLNCPFCRVELGDTDVARGRCPACSGVLVWGGQKPTPREEDLPSALAPPQSYQDILRTVVEAAAEDLAAPHALPPHRPEPPAGPEPASGPPAPLAPRPSVSARADATVEVAVAPQAAPPSPFATPTVIRPGPRWGGGAGGAAQPRFLSPDDEARMTALWAGSAVGHSPLMTVKTEVGAAASPANLVIRTRRVRPAADRAADADYQILGIIGEGGVGVVYAARQRSIDRTVAVKTLRDATRAAELQQDKFLAEAVVTGELDHPNIVPIYDLGRDEDGSLFYSMKRVQGTPWNHTIGEKSQAENLEILMKVADAVAFAHARGVIHRDLKPENVMLGDFGEVLVMDWGIALPTKSFSKSGTIGASSGIGGTPAYMAPEMATGPLDAIGPASDVYLLGAILYEIVAGHPPHLGRDVMDCVRAAARNEITPTHRGGELIDIALRAMATAPGDRFASVREFQAALREYQSHSESILLARRAEDDLQRAQETGDYRDYARAAFGFQESLALWDANAEARLGLERAHREYAEQALRNEDFDLGLSLLDERHPAHAGLRSQLLAAQQERNSRQRRLQTARRMTVGLAAAIFLIVVGALFEINRQRRDAVAARNRADRTAAQLAEKVQQLTDAEGTIKRQVTDLTTAKAQVEQEKNTALLEKRNAEIAQGAAEASKREADLLREQEERQGYVAQIGLADEKIADNAFDVARAILAGYAPPLATPAKARLRHWEWGRLMYLCRRDLATLDAGLRAEAVAISDDGRRLLAGGLEGKAYVWDLLPEAPETPGPVKDELDHGGPIHAVAFAPGGEVAATAGAGGVALWDLRRSPPVPAASPLIGHRDDVLSVAFSRDGRRLLTASRDATARLWDWRAGRELQAFRGHHDPVYCAAFSADERRVATAGEDRVVAIWRVGSLAPPVRFFGHQGPVYAVAFAPPDENGEERLASAGYDKEILIWSPDEAQPFDFAVLDALARNEPPPARESIFPLPPLQRLTGHAAAVRALRFAPDGGRLVSASHDNTVKVWDLTTDPAAPSVVRTLRGHGGWVRACDVGADANAIASAGYDGKVKLWDVAGYEELRVLQGHEEAILGAVFSPQGDRVATAGRDRVAKIWPVAGGEPVTLAEGPEFLALNAVFFDEGRTLAASSGDDTVRKWSRTEGGQIPFAAVSALRGTGRRGALAVTHDGRWLITGSDRTEVYVWDAQSGARAATLTGHRGEPTALAVSPDDQWLASADERGLCLVWRRDAAGAWSLAHRLQGHTPGHAITAIRFLPPGQLLTASDDKSVGRWDAATGEELRDLTLKHEDSVKSLDVSQEGRWALTMTAGGVVRLWHVPTARAAVIASQDDPAKAAVLSSRGGRAVVAFRRGGFRQYAWDAAAPTAEQAVAGAQVAPWRPQAPAGEVWTLRFSPEEDALLTVGGNHARLWDLATGSKLRTFSPNGVLAAIGFSSAGDRVATASSDGTVKVWDAGAARVVRQLTDAHGGLPVNAVAFSPAPGDARLLTAGDDGAVRLWDADAGQRLGAWERHTAPLRCLAFSADARHALAGGDDGQLWRLTIGPPGDVGPLPAAPFASESAHARPVLCVACAARGAQPPFQGRVAAGGEDNVARVWSSTGELLLTLRGHTAAVTAVAFSPDGLRVLTASADNTAKLWDAATGTELLTLKRHGQPLTAAAFSADGRAALTASREGIAILWPSVPWQD